ncbi:MAG: hypothetical protein EZS28_013338 [Streblomastix strix]|uniref:Uncharacterized protein n=1 Tax=Streblomastix strix TaxID=222440 RepID=A0A5J4W909_9EUKA|nr:MAG: hypothetical protein EZS28_013338 [Streblomastix strix]
MPKQILQQNSTPQIPRILTLILPKDITLDHFKIRGIENVYFPKEWIVKLDKSEHTMVVFDHEINSGVWEFTVKGGNLQNWFGIGIINAKQTQIPHPYLFNKQDRNNTVCYVRDTIYIRGLPQDDSGNTEIRSDEQVTAVVDLKSNPPMFYIVVNNTIQPFCVVNIPDKVQFMLFFSTKDSVWEFVSLKELDHGINITRINSNKRFNYQ